MYVYVYLINIRQGVVKLLMDHVMHNYKVLFDDSAFLFYQREMNQQERLIQMNKSCHVCEAVTE